MASSSTSYANKNYNVHDVFLNHRGPDCKKPFATDLYNRLCKHGLRAFLDIEELQEGDGLTCQIEGAIRTASVHIAIFSPRYAESVWCLKELVLMLESKATIIPVFHGVKPSDLRRSNGLYDRALHMLQEKKTFEYHQDKKPRYESDTIRKWRQALYDAADICGFELDKYNGDEQQLLEKVVEAVLKKFPRKLHVSKYPIALEHKVEDFQRKMCLQEQSEHTRVIGIVGHGGVGKTTLAKEIFNSRRSHFNRSCFLFDVRGKPLISLQSQLLKDLAKWNGQISSSDEGIEMVRRYLASSKALIILDDVDHIQQMNALLSPAKDVLDFGSLILVTSRNMDVLVRWGIAKSSIYKLTGLDPQQSKELFCWHAFHQSHPHVGFEAVVNLFLKTCDGLPLSLMVLGAHMHGEKHLKYWEAELRKISNVLPMDIRSRLRMSYDGLDKQEKHIFLDIACFFLHKDRDTAIRIWDGSGWEGDLGFRNLENRCLVEVCDDNQIRMHDHLRDLGRELAEEEPPDCWRRIWCPTHKLLHHHSPVRGVSMVPSDGPEWSPQQFKTLVELTRGRLQLLTAEGDCVESILNVAQPSWQLIWLSWINCAYSSLPPWIPTENLRVLQIKGTEFETIWTDETRAPVQIRELDIDARLLNIPKSIGRLNYLEKFVLQNRSYPVGLKTLPDEFCCLQSLNYLKLSICSEIKSLPDSFGNLRNLQTLDMFSCSQLQGLPDSLGGLASLQTLQLGHCSELQGLPDSLGGLASLQILCLRSCSQLQRLPDSLGGLTSLQILDLRGCSQLHWLPDSLGGLASLQILNLRLCSQLQGLPDSLGGLASLQSLLLTCCYQLQGLPDSLGRLTSLVTLNLFECSHMQRLPDSLGNLTNLRSIDLSGCDLHGLPDSFGSLTNLQSIDLSCCDLHGFPDSLGGLASLQTLYLWGCSQLQGLPDSLGGLASLQILDLRGCSQLQGLPDSLGGLASLQTLDLSGCSHLQRLPESLGSLTSLLTLSLFGCSHMQMLPDSLGNLRNLQKIVLSGCYDLDGFPDSFGNLTNLQRIDLSNCSRLQELPCSVASNLKYLGFESRLFEIPSFSLLRSLEELELENCYGMKFLPDSVRMLTRLRKLKVKEMKNLEVLKIEDSQPSHQFRKDGGKIETFGNSRDSSKVSYSGDVCLNLEEVEIVDCNALLEVGEFPTSLRTLKLDACGALRKVGGLSRLSKLQMLNISRCMELEELSCIEALVSLRRLAATQCGKLKSLQGLAQLKELQELDVSYCSELEDLPGLEHLMSLNTLYASGCPKLQWDEVVLEELRQRLKSGIFYT